VLLYLNLSCGPVDEERNRFLLCPSHNQFPRLGLRTYLSHWVRVEDRAEVEEEGSSVEESH
jgi:hypothetical protein